MAAAHPLPPAVDAPVTRLDFHTGDIAVYSAGPAGARPLVLLHSVNAAASVFEMKPLFEHYARSRRVYAPDLPGFGLSARPAQRYTPSLMTDALLRVVAHVSQREVAGAIDAMALSLGCEFLARAASEQPDAFRSLGLLSPTGLDGTRPRRGAHGSHRGSGLAYTAFARAPWAGPFFSALTSRRSIRFFLRKTFGSRDVDDALVEYAWQTSHQPGAEHAPYSFVSGFLFSADIFSVYESLALPVFVGHGSRGDFVDYRLVGELDARANWTVERFESGAMPHWEDLGMVTAPYDRFDARSGA